MPQEIFSEPYMTSRHDSIYVTMTEPLDHAHLHLVTYPTRCAPYMHLSTPTKLPKALAWELLLLASPYAVHPPFRRR